VDITVGGAVAADNDDVLDAVVPPSLTKDKDAYVGALVAFEGTCIGAFTDSVGESAAASVLLPPHFPLPPSRCAPLPRFPLPPPLLTLPPPPCRRHAAADVALARCHHRQWCVVALPPPLLTKGR
jgi:hypothetical protein